ncbi:uncharacterized protein LOC135486774 [Lineus longissimus]|uniref:uncharacterized protein LOC135486774 n=1 Tax=Lineus longissimus TaxID=88925 RepID=UPI00315DA583
MSKPKGEPGVEPKELVQTMKQQRTNKRRNFTRLVNRISDILSEDHPTLEQIVNVQTILAVHEENFSDIKELNKNIEFNLVSIDEGDAARDAEDACEKSVDNQMNIVKAKNFLAKFKSTMDNPVVPVPKGPVTTSKLPKLTLPTFNGYLTDWLPFWERYTAEIDKNSNISDINRFDYLYGLLEGEALDSVRSLIPSAANYVILKKTLLETFGKDRKIIRAHVLRLFHLRNPNMSGAALRSFYNQVMTDLRSLEALNIDVDRAAGIIVPILEEKLPAVIRGNMADLDRTDVYNLKTFTDGLKRQGERYETQTEDIDITERITVEICQKLPNSSVGAFMAHTSNCEICGSPKHQPEKCNISAKQKRDLVFAKGLCRLCLLPGHFSRKCTSSLQCSSCCGLHHTSLHGIDFGNRSRYRAQSRKRYNRGNRNSITEITQSAQETPGPTSCCSLVQNKSTSAGMDTLVESDSYADIVTSSIIGDNPVLVKTARAKMDYNGTQVEVRIFIDVGSMLSYMRQDVALLLGIQPRGYIDLGIHGFQCYAKDHYGLATVGIMTSDGMTRVPLLISREIVAPISQRGWCKAKSLPHIRGLELADDFRGEPFVVDVLMVSPFIKSNLGALLLGPVHKDRPIVAADIRPIMCFCGTQPGDVDLCGALSNTDLDNRLLTYFRCSEVGVNDVTDDVGGVDENFKAAYSEKIEFQDGKYSVPLPWKEDHGELPSNLRLCRRPLDQIVERLQKTGLMNAYCKVIKEHMDRCYVEEVKGNPWDEEHSHYMPHFFVLKNSETTPVRIVFAANTGRVSLNDCLITGPCMIQNLHDLLLLFRVSRIALVADIARAFLSIGLLEQDRNYVKFLWFRDNDPIKDIIAYRYTTVVFGHTSSPFSLGIVLEKHLAKYECDVAIDLTRKLYMDNLLTSVDQDNEAVNYYYNARAIMKQGGFNLRQWLSNLPELNRILELEGTQMKEKTVSVLGLVWNSVTDRLGFPKKGLINTCRDVTKRRVLSVAASHFDPLGLVTPVIIRARQFIAQQ